MAEYIEREKALKAIERAWAWGGSIHAAYEAVQEAPAADVASVKHGKWEFPIFIDGEDAFDPRVKCSECGEIEAAFARWKYCPNCGARCDLEE